MPEQRLLKMGNPLLSRAAAPVTAFDAKPLRVLVEHLFDTMTARRGIGLAAPQIGVGLRVVVFAISANARHPNAPPIARTALINPRWAPLSDAREEGWEGCLSLPGMRGLVPRYRRIRYFGELTDGSRVEREAEGLHARVVQHECDHLDGVLYPSRMRDLSRFGFEEELSLAGTLTDAAC